MRILLTGANGFLGQPLLQRLSARHEVVTIGRSPTAQGAGHVSVDLAKPGEIEERIAAGSFPDKADVLVHLAVSRLHRTFPDTAPDMFQVNVAATAALVDLARRIGVGHIVLGSTGTVYHPFLNRPMREDETTRPQSYFGWSKLAAEDLARQYAPKHFSLFVPRFFVPYGPGQSDRMVDGMVARVRAGQPVTIPMEGDGLVSSPIYRDDAVEVLERSIEERWEGIVNVGGEEALSLAAMARIIGDVVGREPVIERSAAANPAVILPDVTRLRERIDVSRFVPFREGITRTLAANAAALSDKGNG